VGESPWGFDSPLAHQEESATYAPVRVGVAMPFVPFGRDRDEPSLDACERGALILVLDHVVALVNGIGDMARDRLGHLARRAGVLKVAASTDAPHS
jgi:hypothetical protein